MKRYLKKIKSVAERLDWKVSVDECNVNPNSGKLWTSDTIDFEKYSPAGEDFCFAAYGADMEAMVSDVEDYASCFDQDEHVRELLNAKASGFSGVPSATELVEDAQEIKNMLQEVDAALRSAA